MPEQYSIQEFAAKIRERRPDLASIPDMTLVGKTLAAAPELKQYLAPANAQPVAAPKSDDRTAVQVMQDQAAAMVKGVVGSDMAEHPLDTAKNAVFHPVDTAMGILAAPATVPYQAAKAIPQLAKTAAQNFAALADQSKPIPPQAQQEEAAQGAGKILSAIPVVAGDIAAGKSLANVVKARMTPPISPVTAIEQKITGGKAASAAAAPHIADIAPDLAKDPDLVAAKPGEPFRQTLYRKLQDAGSNVGTVEAAVPDTTPVPKQPILDGLQQLKDVFDRSKAVKASAIVESQMNRLIDTAGGGDTISWGDFSPIKQQLGQDLKEMGVWKRLGTEAQKTTDVALARSYGQYMKATSDISPDLAAANGQYSLLHDATRFSKIDPSTGRYLAEVGEIKPTIWDKAKPWAIRGALGGSLYSLYRDIVR